MYGVLWVDNGGLVLGVRYGQFVLSRSLHVEGTPLSPGNCGVLRPAFVYRHFVYLAYKFSNMVLW